MVATGTARRIGGHVVACSLINAVSLHATHCISSSCSESHSAASASDEYRAMLICEIAVGNVRSSISNECPRSVWATPLIVKIARRWR